MVKFQINEKQYQTPEGWNQVTFEKFLLSLTDLEPKRPMSLRKFLKDHSKAVGEIIDQFLKSNSVTDLNDLPKSESEALSEKVTDKFYSLWNSMPVKEKDKCHKFFSITLAFWCNVESSLIREAMDLEDLKATFWTIEYELNPENAEIDEEWTGFSLNGIEYLAPSKHMEDSTVVEFAESAQFQENMREVENGNWLAMLDVMVVLCRPKGEVYEYQKVKHEQRKRLFKRATMDHVINLAFFLLRLNETLKHNLLIYTLTQEKLQKEAKLTRIGTGGQM